MAVDLQSIAQQAITDLSAYGTAATAVADDQAKLATDQQAANTAATTAQASCQAAIQAFSSALAQLPPTPPTP